MCRNDVKVIQNFFKCVLCVSQNLLIEKLYFFYQTTKSASEMKIKLFDIHAVSFVHADGRTSDRLIRSTDLGDNIRSDIIHVKQK